MRHFNHSVIIAALAGAAWACGSNPAPQAATPAVDSTALRARADSLAAAARRDSLARADSLARVRADSLARAAEMARPDSVRAQVQRGGGDPAMDVASGLDSSTAAALAAPIHFDTDKSNLGPEAVRLLEGKLAIFQANPRLQVEIQGHCDERGPDEYNLALGNRRAAATKQWLVQHGVATARLSIISYGEERPVDPRSTEDAWARNRRAEFRVTRSAR